MLQQTQVATVIPYFRALDGALPRPGQPWPRRTRTQSTAIGPGLGYYRRARNLQLAAAVLARDGWPADLEGLLALPGLGPYTAAALAAQAFQWPTPALDGNAFRVAARLLALEGDPRRAAAEPCAPGCGPPWPPIGPSRITQAIMELGATVCTPAPRCPACPLRAACRAHLEGSTGRIPPALLRAKPRETELYLVAIASPQGWLLRPPARKGLLAGLWSWPWVEAGAHVGAAEAAIPFRTAEGRSWPGWVQVYTHLRQTIHPLALRLEAPRAAPGGLSWVADGDLAALPMGRRDQRLREHLARPASFLPLGGEDWGAALAVLGLD